LKFEQKKMNRFLRMVTRTVYILEKRVAPTFLEVLFPTRENKSSPIARPWRRQDFLPTQGSCYAKENVKTPDTSIRIGFITKETEFHVSLSPPIPDTTSVKGVG
jgi:hypothetical protein